MFIYRIPVISMDILISTPKKHILNKYKKSLRKRLEIYTQIRNKGKDSALVTT